MNRWAEHAARDVATALRDVPWWRNVSGLMATARVSYERTALPDGFSVRVLETKRSHRRIAECAGASPALVIVPGLFAALDERLFVDIAAAAQRRGRAVVVVEDRFAAPTLALNGARVPSLAEMADDLSTILSVMSASSGQVGAPADVLALSAGAATALFASASMRRVAAWSSAASPSAVLAHARKSRIVRGHFARLARAAFAAAHAAPPSFAALADAVGREQPARLTTAPMVLVHAEDDPVAPADDIHRLARELRGDQAACFVPHGGHLGFGAGLGPDIYLVPFFGPST